MRDLANAAKLYRDPGEEDKCAEYFEDYLGKEEDIQKFFLKCKEMALMKKEEINIRDPYVLKADGVYYMYGTRGGSCRREVEGFDCYYSRDLNEWTGPIEVFRRPEDFWADRDYWAPECHYYKGKYYMFATFKCKDKCRGTQILKADSPLGPFHVHSKEPVTPGDWECLDGTLYISPEGIPYIVFCHEWLQIKTGTICARRLSQDLANPEGEAFELFSATDASWIRPLQGTDQCYVTDGPFMYRCKNGELLMLWSSFGKEGYTEAIARSENGDISGPWKQDSKPLFEKDGGHGMIFEAEEGKKYLVLHSPNEHLLERPVFYEIKEDGGMLKRA